MLHGSHSAPAIRQERRAVRSRSGSEIYPPYLADVGQVDHDQMTSMIVSGTILSDEDSSPVGRDGYFMRNSRTNGQSSHFQPDL